MTRTLHPSWIKSYIERTNTQQADILTYRLNQPSDRFTENHTHIFLMVITSFHWNPFFLGYIYFILVGCNVADISKEYITILGSMRCNIMKLDVVKSYACSFLMPYSLCHKNTYICSKPGLCQLWAASPKPNKKNA